MQPIDALERIVHLLDRGRAEPYRVRAFARAAAVVRSTPGDEIAARARAGTLTELDGIGPATATVIAESLDGRVPAYVERLETETVPCSPGGAALRARLRGDCHMHSTWSDGGASIEAMARSAEALGHEFLVITDHSPRLTVAHGLNRERLVAQLDEVAAINERVGIRLLTGMEVDINEDGSLDADDDILERLDVVVASVHAKLRMGRDAMTERMLLAVTNPHVDILGHCTGRMVTGRGRPESEFDADLVFAACARFDKAVEINCRPERLDPPRRLMTRAAEIGCRFAIDTDAHATGQLEWHPYGCDRAADVGIDAARIVNTMPVDDLLAWAGSHNP